MIIGSSVGIMTTVDVVLSAGETKTWQQPRLRESLVR
jgi:hypothetical protein